MTASNIEHQTSNIIYLLDYPLVIQLPLGKIRSNNPDLDFVSHSEFFSASSADKAIIRFYMPELIIFEQAVYTNKPFAFMFYCFYPEPETGDATDHPFKFFTQIIFH